MVRFVKKLAKIKEEQGEIAEAADLMQEIVVSVLRKVHSRLESSWVETFGVMAKIGEKKTKKAFIIKQSLKDTAETIS
ncbi:hypothetical protein C5167_050309 [Papaver somniferum]|uniref:Uncharacterized protein n=1 Tax=Papaver somniferum TaxID=3469 RepID=A0A4Y7KS84_PAPSO|nr:hypothetical protein C5167_050309 [Papaver somniferum]